MIYVFGKKECPQCEFILDALVTARTDHTYLEMAAIQELWEATRHDIYLEAQATYSMYEDLPVVIIEGVGYSFEETCGKLGVEYTECEGGVCKLN